MKEPQLKITQRMLPHWEYAGSVYFITFNTWKRLELSPRARQIVLDACLFFNNQRYGLFALVVMPDHVHMLMQPLPKTEEDYWPLSSIMHSIKSYSAKQIPTVMPHIGTVWQPERYDHIVRSDRAFAAIWNYIRQNPVKAGLAVTPDSYPFLWQKGHDECSEVLRNRPMQLHRPSLPINNATLKTLVQELGDECSRVLELMHQLQVSNLQDDQKADILAEILVSVIHLHTHCDEDLQGAIAEELESLPEQS